jgi:type I restriction enzyme S subunit
MALEDCMAVIIDYRGKTPRKVDFGVPLITAKIIKNGRIGAIEEYIAIEDYDTWMSRGFPTIGDVVMTTEGPLGEVAQLDGRKVALGQRVITLRGYSKVLDNTFLKFQMMSSYVQDQLLARSTGTTVQGIRQSELRKINLVIPPLSEQQAIAHILSSLDDKIELNQQMNETLEGIARALFKSWFVDFDPVRARIEGRQPHGMSAEVTELFPDEFEESTLGRIPSGWKVDILNNLTAFVLGGDWGSSTLTEEASNAAFCIRGADIPDLQFARVAKMPIRYLKTSSLGKREVQSGDIVIEISGGSPTQSTGRPVLITDKMIERYQYPVVCSNFCRMLRVKNCVSPKYVYFLLRGLYDSGALLQYENGTTGIKNFAYNVFSKNHKLVIPPVHLLKHFEQAVDAFFEKREANGAEQETLLALRDTLLPKLLSGAIRVKDAEKAVESVL